MNQLFIISSLGQWGSPSRLKAELTVCPQDTSIGGTFSTYAFIICRLFDCVIKKLL